MKSSRMLMLMLLASACGAAEPLEDLPTLEDQEEAIALICEQNRICDEDEDYSVEWCQEVQLSSYQASEECLKALYSFDACVSQLTCEEREGYLMPDHEACAEEREEALDIYDECRWSASAG